MPSTSAPSTSPLGLVGRKEPRVPRHSITINLGCSVRTGPVPSCSSLADFRAELAGLWNRTPDPLAAAVSCGPLGPPLDLHGRFTGRPAAARTGHRLVCSECSTAHSY